MNEHLATAVACVDHARASLEHMQRVTLVGYRACGKSTLSRLLAAELNWSLCDADTALEQGYGESIAAMVARSMQEFRDKEAATLQALLAEIPQRGQVIATGGGVIERAENRTLLQQQGGHVVYLQASVTTLEQRLRRNRGGRPSLTGQDPAAEVAEMLARREQWYQAVANQVIDANGDQRKQLAQIRAALEL